ncbi:MAG TPA: T9SS type A sorting domain-containing protein [Flavobacteriales bacterium]|nr:T9SS type A sorting domain-containing protein [Flavobacteriales bacterium]HNM70881.1 T9SS type A sorting domain-containing protein [Flavobacteriales bacterium]
MQIRFHHDGANYQTSHYHWQVDDISISTAPATDARVFDGYCSHRGDGTEHGRIPQNQLGGTMNLGGYMVNEGATPLTNATLTAVVTDNATSTTQFTASATSPSLVPGDTLIMNEWPTFGTLATGAYTVTFTGTSDEQAAEADPDNNGWVRTFQVTESGSGMIYSLDEIGGHPQGTQVLSSIGTDDFTDGADGLIVFTYYPVQEDLTVDAISFRLATGSTSGGFYSVAIHDSTAILNDDPGSPLAESDEFDLTVSTGTVVVPLTEPITLGPGAYYASVTMYSNANENDFKISDDATIPQPGWSSGIFVQGASYTNGTALAIQLRNAAVGMDENSLEGVGIWPNPTDGVLNVNVRETGTYRVDVMNSLGQTVSTQRMNGSSKVDLGGLAKGVYSVRVSTDKASTTQSVVLR